jgi:hypothetical protein
MSRPFRALFYCISFPRALPWGGMYRPFRPESCKYSTGIEFFVFGSICQLPCHDQLCNCLDSQHVTPFQGSIWLCFHSLGRCPGLICTGPFRPESCKYSTGIEFFVFGFNCQLPCHDQLCNCLDSQHVTPFQGSIWLCFHSPGRCPGLICNGLSGLILSYQQFINTIKYSGSFCMGTT